MSRSSHIASDCVRRRGQLKCDDIRADTRFRLTGKRTSPLKSAGASVQPATGSRGVRISGRNAGYTMFRGSVKSIVYPLHSPVSPSLPLPCVTVCQHISTGLYMRWTWHARRSVTVCDGNNTDETDVIYFEAASALWELKNRHINR
jgi:hypothetical protein